MEDERMEEDTKTRPDGYAAYPDPAAPPRAAAPSPAQKRPGHVVTKVADQPVAVAAPGPLVNPASWFKEGGTDSVAAYDPQEKTAERDPVAPPKPQAPARTPPKTATPRSTPPRTSTLAPASTLAPKIEQRPVPTPEPTPTPEPKIDRDPPPPLIDAGAAPAPAGGLDLAPAARVFPDEVAEPLAIPRRSRARVLVVVASAALTLLVIVTTRALRSHKPAAKPTTSQVATPASTTTPVPTTKPAPPPAIATRHDGKPAPATAAPKPKPQAVVVAAAKPQVVAVAAAKPQAAPAKPRAVPAAKSAPLAAKPVARPIFRGKPKASMAKARRAPVHESAETLTSDPARAKRGKKSQEARASETPAVADPAAPGRARDAYQQGNGKLFAGDSDEAIDRYKEAIRLDPGYAGGYRGLGLAYAEKGRNADAINALKMYVKMSPRAKDLPLVKKRIGLLRSTAP